MFFEIIAGVLTFVVTGMVLCLYVDLNVRARSRAGTLPPRMPMLVLRWWGLGTLGYVFSPAFSAAQDRKTRWAIVPVRIWFAVNYLAGPLLIAALLFWPNRL